MNRKLFISSSKNCYYKTFDIFSDMYIYQISVHSLIIFIKYTFYWKTPINCTLLLLTEHWKKISVYTYIFDNFLFKENSCACKY